MIIQHESMRYCTPVRLQTFNPLAGFDRDQSRSLPIHNAFLFGVATVVLFSKYKGIIWKESDGGYTV